MYLPGTSQIGDHKLYGQVSPSGYFIQEVTRLSTSSLPMPPNATCSVLGTGLFEEEKRIKITNATSIQQTDIRGVSRPTQAGIFWGKKAEIIAGSLRTMLDYLRTTAFPF